jgi:hypothetical protein
MCQHCLNFFQFVQAFNTIFLFSWLTTELLDQYGLWGLLVGILFYLLLNDQRQLLFSPQKHTD